MTIGANSVVRVKFYTGQNAHSDDSGIVTNLQFERTDTRGSVIYFWSAVACHRFAFGCVIADVPMTLEVRDGSKFLGKSAGMGPVSKPVRI